MVIWETMILQVKNLGAGLSYTKMFLNKGSKIHDGFANANVAVLNL